MKKKIIFAFFAGILILYFSSYSLIRSANKKTLEMEGCPPKGCVEINFPAKGFYNIYRPIIGTEVLLFKTKFADHGR